MLRAFVMLVLAHTAVAQGNTSTSSPAPTNPVPTPSPTPSTCPPFRPPGNPWDMEAGGWSWRASIDVQVSEDMTFGAEGEEGDEYYALRHVCPFSNVFELLTKDRDAEEMPDGQEMEGGEVVMSVEVVDRADDAMELLLSDCNGVPIAQLVEEGNTTAPTTKTATLHLTKLSTSWCLQENFQRATTTAGATRSVARG